MSEKIKKITGGVYLVVDPSMERPALIEKVEQALTGGVNVIQIWNHWPVSFSPEDKKDIIQDVMGRAGSYDVPVLINEEWELLKTTQLDGVHFDEIPEGFEHIKKTVERPFITGITCSNDLGVIRWAENHNLDYISFCSMFPSASAGICEIVEPETVKKARELTRLPLFLSGGITEGNVHTLKDLNFDGVAVISGILNTESPEISASRYHEELQKLKINV